MKQVRLDMGREWYNTIWENYCIEQGLDFKFTIPYTYQQNGAVEHSIYTILDGTRTVLAESELPVKYWVDTIQMVVYIWNLLPNFRQPKAISAEL